VKVKTASTVATTQAQIEHTETQTDNAIRSTDASVQATADSTAIKAQAVKAEAGMIINEDPRSRHDARHMGLSQRTASREGRADDVRPAVQRSDLPCPMLISDTMDAAEHVDGRFYTSKSEFRKVTRANGLTEVGTEKINRTGGRRCPRPSAPRALTSRGAGRCPRF
jgi:hypothetical protein